MTIDAFDWAHRTGANPPDDRPTDPCTSAPARPHLYEGSFAHEYQHLLESYQDPDEVNWVNEGLSDWAQTLVGYVDPTEADHRQGLRQSHPVLPRLARSRRREPDPARRGGPENSLTRGLTRATPRSSPTTARRTR